MEIISNYPQRKEFNNESTKNGERHNRNQSQLTEKDIAYLWKFMASAYGSKWTNQFGDEDNGIWLDQLQDLSREDLKAGLKAMVSTGNEWPPTLPEFRKYCLIGDSKLPTCNEEWERLGNSMKIRALGGESWTSYIARIKTAISRGDAHNHLRIT